MKIPSPRLGLAGASYSLPDSFIIPSRHCKCVLLCLAGTMAVIDLDDVFSILVIFKYIYLLKGGAFTYLDKTFTVVLTQLY